jgi:cytochrome c peroxidase
VGYTATLLVCFLFHVTCPAKSIENNTQRAALRNLGQRLFTDPQFSHDGKVSCATCHKPDQAFSDGKKVAIGTEQQPGTRNTPSLLSLTEAPFFWDGRASELTTVVVQPFTNPVEMGLKHETEILDRINRSPKYRAAFAQLFPGESATPTVHEVAQALAAYVQSLNGGSNAYDRFVSGSDPRALSDAQQRGLKIFRDTAGCTECHRLDSVPARFTDESFHSTIINPKLARALPEAATRLAQDTINAAALNARIESDPVTSELGHFVVTHDPKDIGAFRTPSLRNVARTAPYMHDGSAPTLRDAVDREIYYRSLQSNRPNTLTEQDRQDLVAFLGALTVAR